MIRPAVPVLILILALAAALAGCAGTPQRNQREADEPASQQAAVGAARQRAKVHTELGGAYLSDGRLAVALEEGRTAIEADSSYAPAYNLLGLVHMYLQENRVAEENFEKALRYAPDDAEISNNFGWFLCQTGQEKRSIAYFQTAIKNPLYSTPSKPYTNAGICSLRLKDDKAAEGFLQRALQADPNSTTAHYWLADIFYRYDRLAEARAQLAELIRLAEPEAASVWLALRVERKLGDREAEARYASQLRRKFAGSPEYQKLMQGQYE